MDRTPARGEVWYTDLGETIGHEQAGHRPALIVSTNRYNRGLGKLVVVLPITSTVRDHPLRITILPPDGGLRVKCQVQTDQIRTVSIERLDRKLGKLSELTMALIENRLKDLLDLF